MIRAVIRAVTRAAPLALLALLAACKEEPPRATGADPRLDQARIAAAEALRQRVRAEPAQRGVQVFAQALAGQFAVCGRLAAEGPLLPYVAVVVFEQNVPRVADFALGATGVEAGRVFAEMVERCFEGGGPLTARASARPLPPLPTPGPIPAPTPEQNAAPLSAARPQPPPSAADAAARPLAGGPATPTGRTVTTTPRHGANLRAAPGGGGEVIRVAPRASTLDVFAEAPGGWFQVGQGGQVWGWVHASVLER